MTSIYQSASTASTFSDFARSNTSESESLHLSVDHPSPYIFHHALDSTNPTPTSLASRDNAANDSFHSHKEPAITTSNFIFETFGCSPDGDNNPDEPFCYGLNLPHFIARCIHIGNIPYNYVWGTVLLLMRYHDIFEKGWDTEDVYGTTPLLGHSMFLCALYYATQEYFDPTGRSDYCLDALLWVEMTGFSMDEAVLHQCFWKFFASLSGNVDVDCCLNGVSAPSQPPLPERRTRPHSAKGNAQLPQPSSMRS